MWTRQELVIKVPGKSLAEYPPEEQKRKEVQLEANMYRSMTDLAETAGENLRIQSCTEDGKPAKIDGGTIWELLDLLY